MAQQEIVPAISIGDPDDLACEKQHFCFCKPFKWNCGHRQWVGSLGLGDRGGLEGVNGEYFQQYIFIINK